MSKTTWVFRAMVAASLAVCGCQEPDQIISAPPPGLDFTSTRQVTETEPAQALGETGRSAADTKKPKAAPDLPMALPTAKGEVKKTASGVEYETVKEGTGAVARAGKQVNVHYVGTLDSGKKFESSRDQNKTFSYTIGTDRVIKGWDEAIPGMRIGEVRKLTVPPNAGYGAQGSDPAVPPNATLHFEVELIDVK